MLSFLAAGLLAISLSASFAADAPAQFKVSEFTFKPPTNWHWNKVEKPMRKAQLTVGEGKESAEVVFFSFPGNAGGTQANVDRWLAQFEEDPSKLNSRTEKIGPAGKQATVVQAEGTFMAGDPGGPKTAQAGSMLLGAIMDSDEGNVYIKMTGPKKTVVAAAPAFRKMIEDALR